MKILEYDKNNLIPIRKKSICSGEEVVGFKNIHTGRFIEYMVIENQKDLEYFMKLYNIKEDIKIEY